MQFFDEFILQVAHEIEYDPYLKKERIGDQEEVKVIAEKKNIPVR